MMTTLTPLSLFLRRVPDAAHAEVLSRLFSHLLKGQWLAEQLTDVAGKRVCLAIQNTGNELVFVIQDQRLRRERRSDPARAWDVRISGQLEDFWRLATRQEDPDTLFFNRRLTLEGETETGLYIKNLLDALEFDWDAHLDAVLGPRLAPGARRLARASGMERGVRRVLGRLRPARPFPPPRTNSR